MSTGLAFLPDINCCLIKLAISSLYLRGASKLIKLLYKDVFNSINAFGSFKDSLVKEKPSLPKSFSNLLLFFHHTS